jgi:hypothetical protein
MGLAQIERALAKRCSASRARYRSFSILLITEAKSAPPQGFTRWAGQVSLFPFIFFLFFVFFIVLLHRFSFSF